MTRRIRSGASRPQRRVPGKQRLDPAFGRFTAEKDAAVRSDVVQLDERRARPDRPLFARCRDGKDPPLAFLGRAVPDLARHPSTTPGRGRCRGVRQDRSPARAIDHRDEPGIVGEQRVIGERDGLPSAEKRMSLMYPELR